MMADVIFSELSFEQKNAWGTDPIFFEAVNKEFNFALDAAASHSNRKCEWYLTKEDNALEVDWSIGLESRGMRPVWVNPPYGRGYIKSFMEKAVEQKNKGVTTVLLVPATLDARWLPVNNINEIRIITGGRLNFIHPLTGKKINGNTKGSMLVIFRPIEAELKVTLVDRDYLIQGGNHD